MIGSEGPVADVCIPVPHRSQNRQNDWDCSYHGISEFDLVKVEYAVRLEIPDWTVIHAYRRYHQLLYDHWSGSTKPSFSLLARQ